MRLLKLRLRRRRDATAGAPTAVPATKPLHGLACQCWVCGYTILLPTYSLVRPYTQRLST
ncbi:hypothetical protein ACFQZ4_19200 [Catellatospora coxensis]|uniref:hypothetical protein n=1 Tax=Catellatospora coxensis TaxID=310354 RepID=UPI0019451B08|nr:hypothetical protein [Catellatospora coxensis]